jgi:branched-chain amino acid transport system permease protein
MAEFLQFLLSGITIGATYALVGLGFSIIYNASHVINFAQGEFVMLGGMGAVYFLGLGLPLPVAIVAAICLAAIVGLFLERLAVGQARDASVVALIIITIGAAIFLRGLAQLLWGKSFHSLPPFSGEAPIRIGGATILPQNLWVVGSVIVIVLLLWAFFNRTRLGKGMLATSHNRLAAMLAGVDTRAVMVLSFMLSGALGAIAGVLITPIAFTNAEVGIMLGLKGFSAAILGGLGSGVGAVAGGVLVGIAETMTAGYVSSDYKDAVAFLVILLVLFFRPSGLFGRGVTERV